MVVAAIVGVGLAAGLARRAPDAGDGVLQAPDATTVGVRADGRITIDEGGRVRLDADTLTGGDVVPFSLTLAPEARGDGVRRALVVSVDGRKLETRTAPLEDRPDGVQLDVDAGFLRRGRYLVQIDTAGDAPLAIRRYVIEVE
jgi:hypothetical protein